MKLSKLLIGIDYECLDSIEQIEIENIQYDSRKVKEGDLFVCIKGFSTDGHKYAEAALKQGAAAILCEDEIKDLNCIVIKTKNSRRALAVIAANFYGRPSEKIKLIGITGTNGKTTTTYMIKAILEKAGYKVGLVGTIANYIGNKRIDTHRTTPESLELQQLFYEMTQEKIDYCVMEVSSHSLVLDRVYGLKFEVGIFSNLTRDHLDFHKTFENYYNAKMILFKNSSTSVLNVDDEYGNKMKKEIKSDIITYAIDSKADYSVSNINMGSKGIQFDICHNCEVTNIDLNIPGRYNIYNALCAAIACKHEGIKDEYIIEGLKSAVVPGRCEIVTKDYDLGFEIIVDYAHSPDSLENILKTAREFTAGRLICVFGCGGDRDKTKRPIMGSIAAELSDIAIVTSDNPRSEEPMTIIEDIVAGIKKQNFIVVENRKEAIKKSIEQANSGDVIVIAGKGHEDYQEIKGVNYHFDEKEIIKEILDSYRR